MDDTRKMKAADLVADNEISKYSPEKKLLLAVFLRFLADLGDHIDFDIRQDAIEWFDLPDDGLGPVVRGYFLFHEIAEHLDFSSNRTRKVLEQVQIARHSLNMGYLQPCDKGCSFKTKSYARTHASNVIV